MKKLFFPSILCYNRTVSCAYYAHFKEENS